jgi:hypothetical protein
VLVVVVLRLASHPPIVALLGASARGKPSR